MAEENVQHDAGTLVVSALISALSILASQIVRQDPEARRRIVRACASAASGIRQEQPRNGEQAATLLEAFAAQVEQTVALHPDELPPAPKAH